MGKIWNLGWPNLVHLPQFVPLSPCIFIPGCGCLQLGRQKHTMVWRSELKPTLYFTTNLDHTKPMVEAPESEWVQVHRLWWTYCVVFQKFVSLTEFCSPFYICNLYCYCLSVKVMHVARTIFAGNDSALFVISQPANFTKLAATVLFNFVHNVCIGIQCVLHKCWHYVDKLMKSATVQLTRSVGAHKFTIHKHVCTQK